MENLKLILENYLKRDKNKSNYALLLNGKWGVGKTYYFKNTIIPFVNRIDIPADGKAQTYQVIYVSLNGLSKVSEIVDELQTEELKSLISLSNANGKANEKNFFNYIMSSFAFKGIKEIGKELLKKYVVDFDKLKPSEKEKLSKLRSITSFLVCFDDLERCAIPIKEVFGFINSHLVEHYGIKTLIIANEEEILKTLATDTAKSGYLDIKEKVIGRTVLFEPNQSEIIDAKIKDSKYKNLFSYSKPNINKSKPRNLRTLFFAFEMVEDILDLISNNVLLTGSSETENQQLFTRTIIIYTFSISIIYKENFLGYYHESRYGSLNITKISSAQGRIFEKIFEEIIQFVALGYCKENFGEIVKKTIQDLQIE